MSGPDRAGGTRGVRGRRWSLRTRLVVSAVALIAVVASVIGAVTTIAFRSYLYNQLDTQVQSVAGRAAGPQGGGAAGSPPPGAIPGGDKDPLERDPLEVVTGGGAPLGTVGAVVSADGTVGRGLVSDEQKSAASWPPVSNKDLTSAQSAALATVVRDSEPHTVTLPGLGDYRVTYIEGPRGDFLVGVPLRDVQDNLSILVLVEVCVTLAGLVAAGIAGGALVGVALRPLRRVATTATQVSELPLHSGEVAPLVRVPAAEADPRTEVGQVGAALNRMLGHVGSALTARQESETRVRQFVADAGHELRTPLASIRGYAELTRRGREETGPDTRYALGRIEAEAQRMSGLVEDLLLLARLDAGRPLAYETTDLSPLVVDALSDAHAAGQGHHWRLELPGPEEPPATVHGDASRLHQVLVNLLANARTHTPPGTTVVARVRTSAGGQPGPRTLSGQPGQRGQPWQAERPGHGSCVVLDVRDDGPGIPATLLPHVFERFARGDASRSRAAGSTGLGLAIVQAVVTAHGGTVTVESAPGRTVFSVRLPHVPAQAAPCPQPSAQDSAQPPAQDSAQEQDPAYDSQTGHRLTTRP
ncbi:sensor histidine kinase [Streptomyces sp. NPDC096310]|uniref:HAMP domain-containing sensor histidine kinase n=1 Tax=Streptomyces sp. NPDC096310 TaxID=3366082 RepID=UPI00380697DF